MTSYNAQAEERSKAVRLDQHGRKWHCITDGRGRVTVAPEPLGWTAPQAPSWFKGLLVPPSNVVKAVEQDGEIPALRVDYDAWMTQNEEAERMLRVRGIEIAQSMSANYQDLLDHPTPEFLLRRGASPFPSSLIIQMMQDGDEWTLGQTDTVPGWFAHVQDDTLYSVRAGNLLAPARRREIEAIARRQRLNALKDDDLALPEVPSVEGVEVKKPKNAAKPKAAPVAV